MRTALDLLVEPTQGQGGGGSTGQKLKAGPGNQCLNLKLALSPYGLCKSQTLCGFPVAFPQGRE